MKKWKQNFSDFFKLSTFDDWIGRAFIVAAVLSIGIFLIHSHERNADQAIQHTHYQSICNLDEDKFISTINQWRISLGVKPLSESNSLDIASESRLYDMLKYKYYGHTNPVTKIPSYIAIYTIDKTAHNEGEVLTYTGITDDPTSAALAKFKDSSDHYQLLTSPIYNYIGADFTTTLEYEPSYDDSGNLDSTSTSHALPGRDCMIVADLADQ